MSDVVQGPTKTFGDLLIHVEYLGYCTRTATVRNQSGASVRINNCQGIGYPVKAGTNGADFDLAFAGDEANVTGLLVKCEREPHDETIAATTTAPNRWMVLVHPPAILNQDKFAVNDLAAAAFNQATLQTRLKALGYELRKEPTKWSELGASS